MVWPALIGAGASIIGGLMGKSSQDEANRINQENALRQEALQKEFAQSGIQWKVQDAQKAGIHPLYALGANTVNYAPHSVGAVADTSLPNAISRSGQDISRALEATRTADASDAAFVKTSRDLSLQKAGLENELLATQVAKMRGQIGPTMPGLTDKNPIEGQPAPRSVTLFNDFRVPTNPRESQQDDISKEYGDEGLPQLPGQYRFMRDSFKAAYSRWFPDFVNYLHRYNQSTYRNFHAPNRPRINFRSTNW